MHEVEILYTEFVTHDTKSFITTRPDNFHFIPGQAVEMSIATPEEKGEMRPFTMTSSPEDQVLQFVIKQYPEHEGVTMKLHELSVGDHLLITDPFGTLTYKEKGVFIAGGAGITPFISIFRKLAKDGALAGNKFLYSNKTEADILFQRELMALFGKDVLFTLTRENKPWMSYDRISAEMTKNLLGEDSELNYVYVCGPKDFNEEAKKIAQVLGFDSDTIRWEGK